MNSELMERLNDYIDDLMWADHAEVSKAFLSKVRDRIESQSAELSRLSALVAWQDIETAPRDWSDILLFDPDCDPPVFEGYYSCADGGEDCWRAKREYPDPTHWIPLPAPPVSQLKDTTNADK